MSGVDATEEPTPEFLGTAVIPGDAVDLSGDTALLENGEPRNRLGGFSALEYSGKGMLFASMSDRGPDDGAVDYHCRVQLLELDLSDLPASSIHVTVHRTTIFTDSAGRRFSGSSAAIQATKEQGHRLDPEGFRYGSDGSMYVSDEYGPHVIEFSADGRELRRFQLPDHLQVAIPDADKKKENSLNQTGRASNRGLECLAVSHDGQHLVALMQGPLLQDGTRTDNGIVVGQNCRLIQIELATGRIKEFVYRMDSPDNGNSEILACGPDQYLVLERDSQSGESAGYRKLIRIDLSHATDVVTRETLPSGELPPEIVAVERSVYLDFLAPQWKLAGATMPEKIEGLTYGPALADGRKTLLVGTDNDFESNEASRIWVFAVPN
ncbi:MAG: esterase-like activity of phytase family protein [Planctomycetaceae bacterium]